MRTKFLVAAFLLCLMAFAIPIEHKYDKIFRFFSLTLVPNGMEVPSIFDKKIYFYASDIAALFLCLLGLTWYRIPISQFFTKNGSGYLGIIFLCALASIVVSPFAQYPVAYCRLLQLLTPVLLFSFVAHAFKEEEKERIIRYVLFAVVAAACLQTVFAIAQYFRQDWLGLRIIGEQRMQSPFGIFHAKFWIFDKIFSTVPEYFVLFRPSGTFPHPNVLGGFLALSILSSYYLIAEGTKKIRWGIGATLPFQFFALFITFSRSALFALLLGTFVWYGLHLWKKGWKATVANRSFRFLTWMICFSAWVNVALLYDQLAQRGGIVNYNATAQNSDKVRIHYQNVAIAMMEKNPWLGVGFHQFSLRYPSYLPKNTESTFYLTATHNIYLLLGSETGLISLGAFLLFIGSLIIRGFRVAYSSSSFILLSIFIAFLFIGGCDFYPLLFQQGKLMLFLIAGLLAARSKKQLELVAISDKLPAV